MRSSHRPPRGPPRSSNLPSVLKIHGTGTWFRIADSRASLSRSLCSANRKAITSPACRAYKSVR